MFNSLGRITSVCSTRGKETAVVKYLDFGYLLIGNSVTLSSYHWFPKTCLKACSPFSARNSVMEAVSWEGYSLLHIQTFFESFVLQFLPVFTHLIHSNLMSTANPYKSLCKNIDSYCCSHISIKKCTFSARGSYLLPSPNWSCMYCQWEIMAIIGAYGIPKCIYLKSKHPFSCSYSHCPCEWQADRMLRGPGLHKHQYSDLWSEDKWGLWATELSLLVKALHIAHAVPCQGPGEFTAPLEAGWYFSLGCTLGAVFLFHILTCKKWYLLPLRLTACRDTTNGDRAPLL